MRKTCLLQWFRSCSQNFAIRISIRKYDGDSWINQLFISSAKFKIIKSISGYFGKWSWFSIVCWGKILSVRVPKSVPTFILTPSCFVSVFQHTSLICVIWPMFLCTRLDRNIFGYMYRSRWDVNWTEIYSFTNSNDEATVFFISVFVGRYFDVTMWAFKTTLCRSVILL